MTQDSAPPPDSMPGAFLDARGAAELLGVRRETLYAYVSRGLVRSEAVPGTRHRRYHRGDLEKLARRQRGRRGDGETALSGNALYFGEPVLETALTRIEDGRLYYRGHEAVELARSWRFEEVAAELWSAGGRERAETLFAVERTDADRLPGTIQDLVNTLGDLNPVDTAQIVFPRLAVDDLAAWDTRPEAMLKTGARVLRWLTLLAAGSERWHGSTVETLAQGWRQDSPEARELLSAALILSLDHELNVSAFTARCVASAGSTLYAAVAAALGALQGTRHGGHSRRVEALLRESGDPAGVRRTIADRLRRGEAIPGFGQVLYPHGDPRAIELLRRVEEGWPDSRAAAEGRALREAGWELLGEHPTLDVGLVVTAHVLDLPADAPLTLFALGRSAGWIAQALEQSAEGRLIRPRARYVGP